MAPAMGARDTQRVWSEMGAIFSSGFEHLSASGLTDRYETATPFPHIVIDNVLDPHALRRAIDEFPEVDGPHWTNYLHVNERKFGNTHVETWPASLRAIAEELMSPAFVSFLEDITGIPHLLPDASFDGGGLHRSNVGGFLNIHADYTAHHTHQYWERRVNLLLYLNDDWDESWGGELELWSQDMKQCVEKVSPLANRMVVFNTTATSYHGHPNPLSTPVGIARKSLALYYFTSGRPVKARTTDYRARPGDGPKRVAIFLDKKLLRAYDIVKRRLHISDAAASRWLARWPHRPRKG